MSGHSKWAKIHRKKGIADAKRGASFTKAGNLITIAAGQGGGDPDSNFKLRLAIEKARVINMPKDKIAKAIARGTGANKDNQTLVETTYEIFGPAGSVFIVESITDNKNRTISDIKITASKNGGNLGGQNSVLWMFARKGLIIIDPKQNSGADPDELELNIIDAGAEDIIKEKEEWEIYTLPDKLQTVEQKLKSINIDIKESSLIFKAKDELNIENKTIQEKIEKLYEALDELDDVSVIYTNVK